VCDALTVYVPAVTVIVLENEGHGVLSVNVPTESNGNGVRE
jgi:hypothetical protein